MKRGMKMIDEKTIRQIMQKTKETPKINAHQKLFNLKLYLLNLRAEMQKSVSVINSNDFYAYYISYNLLPIVEELLVEMGNNDD